MATPIPSNHASFTLAEIAGATGGELHGASDELAIRGVCTDSRKVEAGNLYVALRGEQHDGHRYVLGALERGARAVLVEQGADVVEGVAAVRVPDTLRALGDLASMHRARWGGRVIAITGSAGKTTTKELTYAALRAAGCKVARTQGNLNNLVGVPMTLLTLDESVEVLVLEAGTSARGEIARLAEIARPDVAAVTAVAIAHSAGLGTVSDIAAEKASLLWSVPASGAIVYSADHAELAEQLDRVRAKTKLGFGRNVTADVRLVDHTLVAEPEPAMRCELEISGAGRLHVQLKLFGLGPALDAAAALALVLATLGRDALARAGAGLLAVPAVPGRLAPVAGPHGALVIDDSYNANPASMEASIVSAVQLARARGGRAACVLGDMRELGEVSEAEHRKLGWLLARPEVGWLFTSGLEMKHAAKALRERASAAGLDVQVVSNDDPQALAAAVEASVGARDVVLVKGSRGMQMERVVQRLAAAGAAVGGGAA